MDRRQQKTRAAIFDALSSLLAEKNYDHISVQEIADRANVGRSTFYAHFETKDDLLRELCDELFHHVFAYRLDTENTHDFSHVPDNSYAVITHILYHLRDNRQDIVRILSCDGGAQYLQFFKQKLNELYIIRMVERAGPRGIDPDFLINHISSTFVHLLLWWIKGGLTQSPEELTEYFKAVVQPIFRQKG